MKIRFKGGPLNRRNITGPSKQPRYLDAAGNPLPHDEGRDVTLAAARKTSDRASYVYDATRCEYTYIGRLLTDTQTEQLRLLLEQKTEHPEHADRIEAEIRQIEEGTA